jgi:hypothetical protein
MYNWRATYREYCIELFKEDQAFSPSYGFALAPPPTSPLLPSVRSTAIHRKTEKERQLADGRRGGGGGAKSYDGAQAWSSINH